MSDPRWQSPLSHRSPIGTTDAMRLSEWAFASFFVLRGTAEELDPLVQQSCGLDLPQRAGETRTAGSITILWTSPDEWLLVVDPDTDPTGVSKLTAAIGSLHAQLVDVSDYYTTIQLDGPKGRELLAKYVSHDLHPAHFPAGAAISTHVAKTVSFLWVIDENTAKLILRRSHADYLWCLLAEGAREWGVPAQTPRGKVRLHLETV